MNVPSNCKPLAFSEPMMQAFLADQKTMTRRIVQGIDHAATLDAEPHFQDDHLDGLAWDFKEKVNEILTIPIPIKMPYRPGMTVWIRETWRVVSMVRANQCVRVQYRADMAISEWLRIPDVELFKSLYRQTEKEALRHGRMMNTWPPDAAPTRWRPGRFMPRCLARFHAVVLDVKTEQVQDITEADALREGIPDGSSFPMAPEYCPRCRGEGLVGALHPQSLGYMEIDCQKCDTAVKRFSHLWDHLNEKRDPAYTWAANPWVWAITFRKVEASP